MDHVTDTHSIVWYFTDDTRLSRRALDVFEKTIREGVIIIPTVVLAEIMYIAGKGKITLTPIEPKNSSSPHGGGGFRWGGKVQDVHPHPSLPPS
jgi:PIN domain nuclease of toxin-antitoxin system